MGKSARILGDECGLTAQEMNRILKKQGFLEGEPGNYSLTEKGRQFGEEKYKRTGPRSDYVLITYDDSIKKELNITKELKEEIRAEMEEERLQKKKEMEKDVNEDGAKEESVDIEDANNEEEYLEKKEEVDIDTVSFVIGMITIVTVLYKGGRLAVKSFKRAKKWVGDRKKRKKQEKKENGKKEKKEGE